MNMGTENLGDVESPQQPQTQLCSESCSPSFVLLPHHTSPGMQPYHCRICYGKEGKIRVDGDLQLTAHNHEIQVPDQQPDIIDNPMIPWQFSPYRLPPAQIINSIEISRLTTVACLLTEREMRTLFMLLGRAELAAVIGQEMQTRHRHKNLFAFDHTAPERSAMSLREPDTQLIEMVNLKQTLTEMQRQFETQLRQRDIEKKLLSRALTMAKRRIKGDRHEATTATNLGQHGKTLERYLQEEIAMMSLQVGHKQESKRERGLQSQQTQNELEQIRQRLTKQLEESESSRQQLEDEVNRLSKERFDLESSLDELQSMLNGQSSIEQTQITTLQQSLNEAQEKLDQAKATHQKREQELQAALHQTTRDAEQTAEALSNEVEQLKQALKENSAQLSRAQDDQQQWESNLQAVLEKADRSIDENKADYETRIAALRQQIQTQESSHRQLVQEKAELASRLNTETQRALEFVHQAQSLDEHKRSLEHELETILQTLKEAEAQSQKEVVLLKEELERTRPTIDELEASRLQLETLLQQTQAEFEAEQKRLNQALEVAKQHAIENEAQHKKRVSDLTRHMESTRAKAIRQRKKRIKVEAILSRELKITEQLRQRVKAAEEKAETADNCAVELEREQQELMTELKTEIKASQEAWKKASESDIAFQIVKLEYTARTDELEQEIGNLRAQLEHEEESRETTQHRLFEEKDQLQQSLDESQSALKIARTTIKALKSNRQTIRESKSAVDEELAQLKAESRLKEAELLSALESSRQKATSLQQELEDIDGLIGDPEAVEHLRRALQRAEEEKLALKQQIAGLREVQHEMESAQGGDSDAEIGKLRDELIIVERKRKKAEKQAQQADTLHRELQVQENAIEMLSEDLDTLTREKASLIDERDMLHKQLSEIRAQREDQG